MLLCEISEEASWTLARPVLLPIIISHIKTLKPNFWRKSTSILLNSSESALQRINFSPGSLTKTIFADSRASRMRITVVESLSEVKMTRVRNTLGKQIWCGLFSTKVGQSKLCYKRRDFYHSGEFSFYKSQARETQQRKILIRWFLEESIWETKAKS